MKANEKDLTRYPKPNTGNKGQTTAPVQKAWKLREPGDRQTYSS